MYICSGASCNSVASVSGEESKGQSTEATEPVDSCFHDHDGHGGQESNVDELSVLPSQMPRSQNRPDDMDDVPGPSTAAHHTHEQDSAGSSQGGYFIRDVENPEGFSKWSRTADVKTEGLMEGYVDEWANVRKFKLKAHIFADKPRRSKQDKDRARLEREAAWHTEYWAKFPDNPQIVKEAKEYFKRARVNGLIYVAQKGDGPLMFGVRAPDSLDSQKVSRSRANHERPVHKSVKIEDLDVVKVDRRVFRKLVQSGEVITGGPVQGSMVPNVQYDWRGKEW